MFKKVRRNFIIIAMSSVTLVLLIIMTTINIVTYNNIARNCDKIILNINENIGPGPANPHPKPGDVGDNSYFVAIDTDNTLSINEEHFKVRTISKDEALNIANQVKESKSKKGYYDYYRYNVLDNRYIFLDSTNQKRDFNIFLISSSFCSLGGLILFFLLIFFSSKRLLKPIDESYIKQKEFITNASHELKTPLTIISANNELLEINGVKNEYTENISTQVNRLNKLIKNLTNYSKMSEGKSFPKSNIEASKIIDSILESYKLVCDDLSIKLNTDIDKDVILKENKEIFSQIINIIMDNARKYALNEIYVSFKVNKNNVILKECNDTHEIDEGDLSMYTERFYRSSTARTKQDGSGIGLSLLKELCEISKAKLKIYGENNKYNIEISFSK